MTGSGDGRGWTPAEESEVSRRYREIAREEPPAHLDVDIRRRARRRGPVPPWAGPVAIAASLTLSVGLVLRVTQHDPEPESGRAPESHVSPPADRAQRTGAESENRSFMLPVEEAVSGLGRDDAEAVEALRPEHAAEAVSQCPAGEKTRMTWLECIRRLEAEGRLAAAERERRAMQTFYPDAADDTD